MLYKFFIPLLSGNISVNDSSGVHLFERPLKNTNRKWSKSNPPSSPYSSRKWKSSGGSSGSRCQDRPLARPCQGFTSDGFLHKTPLPPKDCVCVCVSVCARVSCTCGVYRWPELPAVPNLGALMSANEPPWPLPANRKSPPPWQEVPGTLAEPQWEQWSLLLLLLLIKSQGSILSGLKLWFKVPNDENHFSFSMIYSTKNINDTINTQSEHFKLHILSY